MVKYRTILPGGLVMVAGLTVHALREVLVPANQLQAHRASFQIAAG
jgi:hypothetical protein